MDLACSYKAMVLLELGSHDVYIALIDIISTICKWSEREKKNVKLIRQSSKWDIIQCIGVNC